MNGTSHRGRHLTAATAIVILVLLAIALVLAVSYGPGLLKYSLCRYSTRTPLEWYSSDLQADDLHTRKRAAYTLMYRAQAGDVSDYLAPALHDTDPGVRRLAIIGIAESRRRWGPLSAMDDGTLTTALIKVMETDDSREVQLTAANYAAMLAGVVPDEQLSKRIRNAVVEFKATKAPAWPEP